MASSFATRSRHALAARLGYAFRHARNDLSNDPALAHVCSALKALGHAVAPLPQAPCTSNLQLARPAVCDAANFLAALATRPAAAATNTSSATTHAAVQTSSTSIHAAVQTTSYQDDLFLRLHAAQEGHRQLIRTIQQLLSTFRTLTATDAKEERTEVKYVRPPPSHGAFRRQARGRVRRSAPLAAPILGRIALVNESQLQSFASHNLPKLVGPNLESMNGPVMPQLLRAAQDRYGEVPDHMIPNLKAFVANWITNKAHAATSSGVLSRGAVDEEEKKEE